MDLFMMIFFIFVGSAGLIYDNEIGVFVGLGLVPWQIIKLRKSKKLNIIAIIITAIIGTIFFVYTQRWVLLALFLFIEVYNYWGHMNTDIKNNENNNQK